MAFEDGAEAHSEKVMVGAGLAGPKTFILGLAEAESVFMVEIQRIERKITHVKKFCFFMQAIIASQPRDVGKCFGSQC
jgi:hypothetical protein